MVKEHCEFYELEHFVSFFRCVLKLKHLNLQIFSNEIGNYLISTKHLEVWLKI